MKDCFLHGMYLCGHIGVWVCAHGHLWLDYMRRVFLSWTAGLGGNLPAGVHSCCQGDRKMPSFQANQQEHHRKVHCDRGKGILPGCQWEHFPCPSTFPHGGPATRPWPWPLLTPSFSSWVRRVPSNGGCGAYRPTSREQIFWSALSKS